MFAVGRIRPTANMVKNSGVWGLKFLSVVSLCRYGKKVRQDEGLRLTTR
jgi:hypothetical protein